MSNPNTAEEMAKKHLDKWNDTTGFVEPDTGYYFEILSVIEDAMQEHTARALDRLKENVEKKETKIISFPDLSNAEDVLACKYYNMALKDIIQLIEEVENE